MWGVALIVVLGFLTGGATSGKDLGAGPELGFTDRASASHVVAVPERVPYTDGLAPVRLRIPAIDVSGTIQPVGMTDAVTMQVPQDISVIGWFDRSALPVADAGNTVLVGHRDGTTDPNGVFRRLEEVRPGDELRVREMSGRRLDYVITSVQSLGRQEFAREAESIFATDGPHRLVLLTCGGSYDAARGGYQSTVVVVAKRA